MWGTKSSEAAEVDKLSGGFLKDSADMLEKPVSALCNLSVSQVVFPMFAKLRY